MEKQRKGRFTTWLGLFTLHLSAAVFASGFMIRAFFRRGRATHTNGVAGRGQLRVVEHPQFPECEFFRPGKEFPLTVRHATALQTDEGCKNLRSMALKFSHELFDSPLDLIMNTGRVQPFWKIPSFLMGVMCAAFQTPGRWVYQHLFPLAKRNVIIGSRRAPETYTQMEYYAALSFGFHARDGVERLCRFRVIPHDRGEETGLPDAIDKLYPWRDNRRRGEPKCKDHLIREYRNRIDDGDTPAYWLQMQVHELAREDTNQIYSIAHEWVPESHPWMDVGEIQINSALPPEIAEALRFRITNQPADLSIPPADSPFDYRCIGWLRTGIYPVLQAWRNYWQEFRTTLGFGRQVQWDTPHVEEWKEFRNPHAQTYFLPLSEETRTKALKLLENSHDRWLEALPNVQSLHYMRIFVLPIDDVIHLAISTVFDGETRDHLDELLRVKNHLFPDLLTMVGAQGSKLHHYREWLIRHGETDHAFFIGGSHHSKLSIKEEQRLRERLHRLLDQHDAELRAKSAETIRLFLQDRIVKQNDPDVPCGPRQKVALPATARKMADHLLSLANPVSGLLAPDIVKWARQRKALPLRWLIYLGLIPWAIYTAIPTAIFLLLIRYLEIKEPVAEDARVDLTELQNLEATENQRLQNNLTMYAPLQPSRLRRWILRIILAGSENGVRHMWNEGRLSGIDSIHFARFKTLDKGQWLLFMSDYDGSWNRYLGDFLTVGSRVVVPIWSNLEGCPKTEWLFNPTPGFAEKFKNFTRSRQIKSAMWFSAYPDLSMPNVISNSKLRDGLFIGRLSEPEASEWLEQLNG